MRTWVRILSTQFNKGKRGLGVGEGWRGTAACNLNTGKMERRESLGLTGQPDHPNCYASGSVRDTVSKHKMRAIDKDMQC